MERYWTGTKVLRPRRIYYWTGTNIRQSWLARLFLRLAHWIDGVPKEWPNHG